jgi:hypothetical protein
LVRLARLLTRDAQRAEDLVQDVLGQACPRWNKNLARRPARPHAQAIRTALDGYREVDRTTTRARGLASR